MALLSRIGLDRPELRAWALYDWANSAFVTIIVTAIFPIYYAKVCNAATAVSDPELATFRLTVTTGVALTIVAFLAPLLGALADTRPVKKKLLSLFLGLGVLSTAGMFMLGPDQWLLASILFGLGNIGAMGSFVFYDSLLPHVASKDNIDRVSTAGYALGYVGGGLLLLVCIMLVQNPQWLGTEDTDLVSRICFVMVALWWLFFSIPLFRRVPEPPVEPSKGSARKGLIGATLGQIIETTRELKTYKQALLFLLAFLIYNDGVGTIIRFAVVYGAEIGVDTKSMILAIVLVQFVGIPFTFVFGQFAHRIGTKKAIYGGLLVYCGVSVLGFFMTNATHFLLLAVLVGMVQGGVQALSRSLFASMIPSHKSGEFFGLFAVFEKFAGLLGPIVFAVIINAAGSSRPAILTIVAFFVIGGLLLARVDVDEGRKQAQTTL